MSVAADTRRAAAMPPTTPAFDPPVREPFDETKAETSMQLLRSLFPDGFGSGSPRGGLTAPSQLPTRECGPGRWDDDARVARELALRGGLLAAQVQGRVLPYPQQLPGVDQQAVQPGPGLRGRGQAQVALQQVHPHRCYIPYRSYQLRRY
jgi:hypothetical protein